MMTASLYEIALGPDKSQRAVVDAITCEAPILRDLPMEPSSHGLWNIYESMKDVTGGDLVDLDAPLPKVSAESELRQTDLSIIGGEMEVGEDTARKRGGPVSYFAKKATPVLRKTGMSAERSLLYDNFRAFAIRNGNVQSAGGTGTKNYSILCVHYVPGEITGVYDPAGFGNGKTFDLTPIVGGELYKNAEGRLVYGMRLKTYFGVQLANPDYVSAIVNCDIDSDSSSARTFPTMRQMDKLLIDARAGQNTFIFCHPAVKAYLGTTCKLEHMTLVSGNGFSTQIDAWNGVPIITSFNFDNGTETAVSL
ncbi:MAG TPA: hypothetical protein DDZ11_08885 [Lentisphaeria bacterium]|nr:hypothetical protein [Lentisphaeria bacterium]